MHFFLDRIVSLCKFSSEYTEFIISVSENGYCAQFTRGDGLFWNASFLTGQRLTENPTSNVNYLKLNTWPTADFFFFAYLF